MLLVESNTLQAELSRQEMQSQEVDHRKHDQSLGAKSDRDDMRCTTILSGTFKDVERIQSAVV